MNSITSQSPAKILVVDEDVDNGLLLKDFLQMSGFDVDVYFSSEEASENFQCGQYSVAILDVLMDGIGGIEFHDPHVSAKIFEKLAKGVTIHLLDGNPEQISVENRFAAIIRTPPNRETAERGLI